MPNTEDHRAKAVECLERARKTNNKELRDLYESLAVQWLFLAEKEAELQSGVSASE